MILRLGESAPPTMAWRGFPSAINRPLCQLYSFLPRLGNQRNACTVLMKVLSGVGRVLSPRDDAAKLNAIVLKLLSAVQTYFIRPAR